MRAISDVVQEYQQAVYPGTSTTPQPDARSIGRTVQTYANRERLKDLDQTHPGVRRAVDAVYTWRTRYVGSLNPANDNPARSPSLVLSGPNGTGKTHIARAILWSQVITPVDDLDRPLMDLSRPAGRWFDAATLMLTLAPAETDWRTVEYGSVGQLIGPAPFVIVDDLGGEGTIPFVAAADQAFERQARWFRFIDFCYDRNVPVIITTNLDIQNGSLSEWIGRRAWDRLNEMAPAGQMVGMWDVPSWRVKAGGR